MAIIDENLRSFFDDSVMQKQKSGCNFGCSKHYVNNDEYFKQNY